MGAPISPAGDGDWARIQDGGPDASDGALKLVPVGLSTVVSSPWTVASHPTALARRVGRDAYGPIVDGCMASADRFTRPQLAILEFLEFGRQLNLAQARGSAAGGPALDLGGGDSGPAWTATRLGSTTCVRSRFPGGVHFPMSDDPRLTAGAIDGCRASRRGRAPRSLVPAAVGVHRQRAEHPYQRCADHQHERASPMLEAWRFSRHQKACLSR